MTTKKKDSKTNHRANGEGSIYYDATRDRWIVKVSVGIDKNGRRIRRTATCISKENAVEAKKALLAKYNGIEQLDAEKMTVSTYIDHYLELYKKGNVKENTYEGYCLSANPIKDTIGHIKLAKLNVVQVKAMMEKFKDAPGTASHSLTVLRMAMRQAVEDGLILKDPTKKIKKPKTGKNLTVITAEEFQKLVGVADGINRMAILIAYASGMRPEEVFGLQWKHVDFQQNTLRVEQTIVKGAKNKPLLGAPKNDNSYRTLKVPAKLIRDLKKWQKEQAAIILRTKGYENNHFIIAYDNGQPVIPGNFSKRMRTLCKNSGIKITMKGLRHTHATQLFVANWHPKDVQERLGHANVAITLDIYTAYIPARAQSIAEFVDTIYPN